MNTTTFLPSPIHRVNDMKTTISISNQCDESHRFTKRFKWAARLTLMLISFVWYGPSVYAAVEEINKPPVMNKIDSFYPLGAELEALRKDLLDAENAVNQRLQLSTDQLANMPIDDLNNKRFLKRKANIKKLDQKQRQQMEATLQHYKNHELSEKIIERQLTENQNHMSSMDALHKALSAIDLNVDSIDQWQSQQLTIKDTLSLLQQPLSNIPQRYSNNFDFVTPPARDIYTTQAQIDGLIGADAGNYTATDSATQSTQSITDKITELGTDPLTLYNWVHDTIRWLPSYGVMQGADYTLQAEQGNAFDTASLLIALLREAGHEARYRYGIVQAPVDEVRNWVGDVKNADAATNLMSQGGIPQTQFSYGGAIEEIKWEHVWVEVNQGGQWHALDPSFKQCTYTEGMDLDAAVAFDAEGLLTQLENSSTSNETEGWVQGVDTSLIETELSNYQTQLESYLNVNAPTATLGDVLGLQTINPSVANTLESTAPTYSVGLNTTVDLLPEDLFYRFQFQLGSAITFDLGASFAWGSELFGIDELTTNLVGKDIAISFRPATTADEDAIASFLPDVINSPEDLPDTLPASSINMVGELTIDGQVVHSTGSMTLGAALKTRMGFQSPQGSYQYSENDLDAGQYQAIGIDMQGVSPTQLEVLQARLENTQTQIEADNTASLTKHDVVGDILQAGIQGYMAMTYATDRIAAQSAGVAYYRQPSYGSFSTALTVAYSLGGMPAQVTFSGVVMDVDRMVTNVEEKANCYEGYVAFNRASGMRNSAYEHQIPEQLFSTDTEQAEGVSTAKALAVAMAQGQKIYTLTSNNANELAIITIDDGARTEIQQALNLGLEVTVHQSPITVNGWQGSGYAILDAEYGVGAYQISGGVSGGFLSDDLAGVLTFFGFSAGLVGGVFGAVSLIFISAMIASILIIDLYLDYVSTGSTSCEGIEILLYLSILAAALSIVAAPIAFTILSYVSFIAGNASLSALRSGACNQ